MKSIRKPCAAVVLLLALSLSAAAGDIHTNAAPPPPPAPMSSTDVDDTQTSEIQDPVESYDIFTDLTLSLLQMLSVF